MVSCSDVYIYYLTFTTSEYVCGEYSENGVDFSVIFRFAQTVSMKHLVAKQSIKLASEDRVRRATERGCVVWSTPLTSLIKLTKCACTNGMSERVKSRHAGLATGCRHKTWLRYCSGWMNSFTWLLLKREIPSTGKTPLHLVAGHSLSRLATLIHTKFRNEYLYKSWYIFESERGLSFSHYSGLPNLLISFVPPLVWNGTVTLSSYIVVQYLVNTMN